MLDFHIAHTPTAIESEDSGRVLIIPYNIDSDNSNKPTNKSKKEVVKKKNPKEVVFLDEESSSASPISIDSDDSKS